MIASRCLSPHLKGGRPCLSPGSLNPPFSRVPRLSPRSVKGVLGTNTRSVGVQSAVHWISARLIAQLSSPASLSSPSSLAGCTSTITLLLFRPFPSPTVPSPQAFMAYAHTVISLTLVGLSSLLPPSLPSLLTSPLLSLPCKPSRHTSTTTLAFRNEHLPSPPPFPLSLCPPPRRPSRHTGTSMNNVSHPPPSTPSAPPPWQAFQAYKQKRMAAVLQKAQELRSASKERGSSKEMRGEEKRQEGEGEGEEVGKKEGGESRPFTPRGSKDSIGNGSRERDS